MLENEKRLLEKTNEQLVRGYGEQEFLKKRKVGKSVRNFGTHFAGMEMCISRVTPM